MGNFSDKFDLPNFQFLFESLPASYLVLSPKSPEFKIIAVSDDYLHVAGKERSSILGLGYFSAFSDNPKNPSATAEIKTKASLERVLTTKTSDAIPLQKSHTLKIEAEDTLLIHTPILNPKKEIQYIIQRIENLAPQMHIRHMQLQESNNRLQAILDTTYDPFVAMDSKGIVTDWNNQAEITFGWSKQQTIGFTLDKTLIPERFSKMHHAGLEKFVRTGVGTLFGKRIELQAMKSDGTEIPIELTLSAVRQGNEYTFGAFLKDISSRKKSERYRHVQLNVTRILMESVSIPEALNKSIQSICTGLEWRWGAFWRHDSRDEKLFLAHQFAIDTKADAKNITAFEIKSRSSRYSKGEGFPGEVWQTMQAQWLTDFSKVQKYPRAQIAIEAGLHAAAAFPIIAGDEFLGVLEFLNVSISDPDPELPEIMSDIVARLGFFIHRKETEEQLRQIEERFSTLVESIKDYAIISIDTEGHVTSWNRGAQQIVGYSSEDIIGQHFSKFYPHISVSDKYPEMEMEMARKFGRFEDEGWRVRKDGSKFWANVILNPIYNRAGNLTGYSKVTRDMTERKIAEQKLNQLNEELEARVAERMKELKEALLAAEEANQAKSAFLANMSHEIRTPLGVVLGYSDLLMDPKTTQAERINFMATIKRNGELLSNVINDILDLSKVEIGKLEIEKTATPITDVLIDITSLLELKAKEKSIQLGVSFKGSLPKIIKTDALRLRQILINIVGNAIKFTERGRVDVTLSMQADETGTEKLAFTIKDTGQGITAEQEKKLFQAFSQADVSTRRRFGGTGLGLILSRHLANLLGGDVKLTESAIGQGSTFTVTIDPGVTVEKGKEEINSHAARPAATTTSSVRLDGLSILVADDSPDNQVLVRKILSLAGAAVDTVDNGQMALEKAQQNNYQIVLMDLQMPIMDGYEATKKLRTIGFKTPIVALTAHALKEEREFCLQNGFDDHVSKPIDRNILIESISRLTESRT